MKKLAIATMTGALALAAIGCTPTANTTANVKVNGANVNANTAVVVNSNQAPITNVGNTATTSSNSNLYNSTTTRADYEKNSAAYSADQAASKIGKGANDSWIWFKAKGALATVSSVRDSTINVDVDNGVITLKGSVASKEEEAKAIAAAKGIEGQKGIKNELKIQAGDSLTNQTVGTGSSSDSTKGNANAKH